MLLPNAARPKSTSVRRRPTLFQVPQGEPWLENRQHQTAWLGLLHRHVRVEEQARINENFFTKLDFVDQVNADQARFRSKIERFHKWCRGSESSSDDNDEKENEVTTVAGCG